MQHTSPAEATPVLELTGETTPLSSLLRDLWRRRALLPMLASKDFHARYRSASLGVLWSVFLPVLQGVVLAAVFTRIVRVQVPYSYPVFVLSGMISWSFFSSSTSVAMTAIVDGSPIATKVYFPRLLLPAVPVAANSVGYAISTAVVVVLMVVLGEPIGRTLLLLPFAMVLVATLAFLVGAITSMMHVYFRDVRYMVQAVLMVGLYGTPVIYPLSQAGSLRPFLMLANPMTGAVQLVRFAVFGEADAVGAALSSTLVWIAALILIALVLYGRYERVAVDRL